jgi:hypothetical protein
MDAYEFLEKVHDRESFFAFVRALIADRDAAVALERESPSGSYAESDAGGWYNTVIETYLSAALNWAQTTGMGLSQGLPEDPSWKSFAVFLYCGKIYE